MTPTLKEDTCVVVVVPDPAAKGGQQAEVRPVRHLGMIGAYALLAFLLLGYHPYAEDGGIYFAAIAARMDPRLFPLEHAWVTAHTAYALFVPAVAFLFRILPLGLAAGLLLLKYAGLFAAVAAVRAIALRCFDDDRSTQFAMFAFAVCAGLPVAGTSLYLLDPYVTARTLTTPLLLWSLYFLLKDRYALTTTCWIAAVLLHPLMAFWGGVTLAYLAFIRLERKRASLALLTALFCGAAIVSAASPGDSALVHRLAMGRAYWFLGQWQWYEVFGAIAPCAILLLILWKARNPVLSRQAQQITIACCCASATALGLALCFARETSRSSVIARCQPLRILHLVFALFVVLAAGRLGRNLFLVRHRWLTFVACATAALGVFWMQLTLYPGSRHLELPGLASHNDWLDAFQWVRLNTPQNALFALDADYIGKPDEDAQGFRAAALRSALPDRAKDGGIASVVPALATDWLAGVNAQTGLDNNLGSERIRSLRALGVTWLIVSAHSATQLVCPYRNKSVTVCRLPDGTQ